MKLCCCSLVRSEQQPVFLRAFKAVENDLGGMSLKDPYNQQTQERSTDCKSGLVGASPTCWTMLE